MIANIPARLDRLRSIMREAGIGAYIVPSADPHLSEYVPLHYQQRAFLSGFDGSAGTLVVSEKSAALWTDSRYFLQAEAQLEGSGIQLCRLAQKGTPSIEDWILDELGQEGKAGLDPALFSISAYRELQASMASRHLRLLPQKRDLVDYMWEGRPPLPDSPLRLHAMAVAGETVESKHARLVVELQRRGQDMILCAGLDEVAWLCNLRGSDVPFNPLFVAYALVDSEAVRLFVDPEKVRGVRQELGPVIRLFPYGSVWTELADLAAAGRSCWMDPRSANQRLASIYEENGGRLLLEHNPVMRWKAAKNPAELLGMRQAHLRDAVAMVEFLSELDAILGKGGASELSLEAELECCRRRQAGYIGPSFRPIIAFGPHGAVVHYSADEASDARIEGSGLLLVDSGGQYLDGTTDITRTLAVGQPDAEQRRAYTAVLKGHLRLGTATFKEGSDGHQLDMIARSELWRLGYDYGHGTGHGVGAALSVHEGPFRISNVKNLTPLEAGNICSNEPGYYRRGAWGVRIENLVVVQQRGRIDDSEFLGFETMTLVPYEVRLIEPQLLSAEEREAVNGYHQRVLEVLAPLLGQRAGDWLVRATMPLSPA